MVFRVVNHHISKYLLTLLIKKSVSWGKLSTSNSCLGDTSLNTALRQYSGLKGSFDISDQHLFGIEFLYSFDGFVTL